MQLVAFGPFEWDVAALELRRRGARVRLPGQPTSVLKALLDEPGRLVTREDLRRSLWGEETFVDFEQGLNTAVARLRQALGDSAEAPRYIETVPGQGYRFIGEIRAQGAVPDAEASRPPDRMDRRAWLAGGLGVAAGAAGAYLLGRLRFQGTESRSGRFVISAPPAAALQLSGFEDVAVAPDGSVVVYACNRGGSPALYLRPLRETEGRFLPGTDVFNPFFSPDGMEIGYYRFPDQALDAWRRKRGPRRRPTSSSRRTRRSTEGWREENSWRCSRRGRVSASKATGAPSSVFGAFLTPGLLPTSRETTRPGENDAGKGKRPSPDHQGLIVHRMPPVLNVLPR